MFRCIVAAMGALMLWLGPAEAVVEQATPPEAVLLMAPCGEPCVLPLDAPDSPQWRWAGAEAETGPGAAERLASITGRRWVGARGVKVLARSWPARPSLPLAEAAPAVRAGVNFVLSLSAEQVARCSEHLLVSPDVLSAQQQAQLDADLAVRGTRLTEQGPDWDEVSARGVRALGVMVRPMLHFAVQGCPAGDVDLSSGSELNDVSRCRRPKGGFLEPASLRDLVGKGPVAGWRMGPYRDVLATEGMASSPVAFEWEGAAGGGPVTLTAPEAVALGSLPQRLNLLGRHTLAVDPRLTSCRVLLSPGTYLAADLIQAVVLAYDLVSRQVGETLLLTDGSRRSRPPIPWIEGLRAVQRAVATRLAPVAKWREFPGLVIPLEWFAQGKEVPYDLLAPDLRRFVEDVWWESQGGAIQRTDVDLGGVFDMITPAWHYDFRGAGGQGSTARQQVREDLCAAVITCDFGFSIAQMLYVQRQEPDVLLASRCKQYGADVPDVWTLGETYYLDLFASSAVTP